MGYRLLPMNSLLMLEACVRTGSLTNAADELGVTPSAVRYQIRQLEELIGRALFDRHGPRITPTRHTLAALPDLQAGLTSLQSGYDRLGSNLYNDLDIVVDVSLAALWLAPLLQDFENLFPDFKVNLLSPIAGTHRKNAGADIVITAHPVPGKEQALILPSETFLPLAAPTGYQPALLTIDPMHVRDTYPNWNLWQEKHGHLQMLQRRYSLAMLALQAAKSGEGIVLASSLLALQDLPRLPPLQT